MTFIPHLNHTEYDIRINNIQSLLLFYMNHGQVPLRIHKPDPAAGTVNVLNSSVLCLSIVDDGK